MCFFVDPKGSFKAAFGYFTCVHAASIGANSA